MVFHINETVTVPLADGSRVRGRVLYLDAAPSNDGKRYADVELQGQAAPVVWCAVSELQPAPAGLGHRCNYTPSRICDCWPKDCAAHFSDDAGGC
jgi:hypothetical protein